MTRNTYVLLLALTACGKTEPAATVQPAAPAAPQEVQPTPAPPPAPAPAVPSDMLLVPASEFLAGAEDDGKGRTEKAGPFAIDRVEVSVEDYSKCRSAGQCTEPLHDDDGCNATQGASRANHPMNCVSWKEARTYCASWGKRLPTAIEWELAARGADKRLYPWGNETPKEQACWQGRKGERKSTTCPVGSFPQGASPFGVLDMAGNVAEWTTTVVPGAYPPPIYEVRGGSYVWDRTAESSDLRVDTPNAGAVSGNPLQRQKTVGFRCAADLR